jgi:surface antigen
MVHRTAGGKRRVFVRRLGLACVAGLAVLSLSVLVLPVSSAVASPASPAVAARGKPAIAKPAAARSAPAPKPSKSGTVAASYPRPDAGGYVSLRGIPRSAYDPVSADGVPQHELLGIAQEVASTTPASSYAGEALDTHAGTVNVYVTSMAARGHVLARVPAVQRSLVRLHQVPLSQAALHGYMNRAKAIARRLLASRIHVQSWWPDFEHGRIGVTLYKPSAAQIQLAERALAGIPAHVTTTSAAVEPASLAAPAAPAAPTSPAAPAAPTSPAAPAALMAPARPSSDPSCAGVADSACDASPWTGADFIGDSSGFCTDSWPVSIGSATYMLTAGHCDIAGGQTYSNQGVDGANIIGGSNTFGSGTTIGTGQDNTLVSEDVDAELIPASQRPQLWTGNTTGNAAAGTPIPVLSAQVAPVGTTICDDGAYEGTTCYATISANNYQGCTTAQEDSVTYTFCDVIEADYATGQPFIGEGDSGGPLFEMTSGGAVAVGLNSLEETENLKCPAYTGRGNVCSDIAFFTSLPSILANYGAKLDVDVVNVSGGGQFLSEWNALGADGTGGIGDPVDAWSAVAGGQQQQFADGGIYWSSATGTHGLTGGANTDYDDLGGPSSQLGFPESEAVPAGAAGEEWQFPGTSCTAPATADGSGSVILESPSTPASEVQGCIYQAYEKTYGGPSGALGYPVSDEVPISSGRVSYFAGSSAPSCSTGSEPGGGATAAVYWNPASGTTHDVTGCIFAEYHSLGEAGGKLGFPTDDAYSYNGGHRQDYQNGSISGSNGSYTVSYNGDWVTGVAAHAGDDYPYETVGQFEHQDEGADAWNEYYGQCDSFAAWKVYENLAGGAAQHPGIPVPAVGWKPSNASISPVNQDTWGNADNWGHMAQTPGVNWTVNNIPAPGTIAWWNNSSADSAHGIGSDGHVGYVTAVYPDGSVTIESYNLRLNGEYSVIHLPYDSSATDTSFNLGSITVPWPSGFIHVGDGIAAGGTLPAEPANGTVSWGYPSQVKVIGPGSPSSEYSLATSYWYLDSGHGELGSEEWTHTNGATADSTATYTPSGLADSTCYEVDAFVPNNYSDNPVAVYTVSDSRGTHLAVVNENQYTNDWAELGVYETNGSGGGLVVKLDDRGTTGLYVAADAMRFWRQTSCSGYGDVSPIVGAAPQTGTWKPDSGHGFSGGMVDTLTSGSSTLSTASASWTPHLLPMDCYEVFAYVPDNYSDNNAATYEVLDQWRDTFWPQVNDNAFTNQFTDLGAFMSRPDGSLPVYLDNFGPSGQYVAADVLAYTLDANCVGVGESGPGLGNVYQPNQVGPGSNPSSFSTANPWYTQLGHGYAQHELWTYDNGSTPDSTATWTFYGSANTCYSVSAYIPDNYADNPQAHYAVGTSAEGLALTLNQEAYTNQFVSLATVTTGSDGIVTVHLDDVGPTGDYTAADAMAFDEDGAGC